MQEINLYDLLKHYARYWLFILLFSLAGLSAGFVYNNYIQTPMYKSSATLLVLNKEAGSTESKTTTINNYLELLKSRRVLTPVLEKLKLDQSYDQIVGSVTTSNDKGTEVVKISIATTNPEQSKNMVDATIASFKEEVSRLYKIDTIQVIDSANLPGAAYNVRKTIQLALFTAAGFLFSIIVVFFIYDYRLSNSSKTQTTTTTETMPTVAVQAQVKPGQTTKPSAYARFKSRRKSKKTAKVEAKKAKIQNKKQAEKIVLKPSRDPKTGRFAPKTKTSGRTTTTKLSKNK